MQNAVDRMNKVAVEILVDELTKGLPRILPSDIDHLREIAEKQGEIQTKTIIGAEFVLYGMTLQDYVDSGSEPAQIRDLLVQISYGSIQEKIQALTDGNGVLLVAGIDDSLSITDREARQLLSLA